MTLQACLHILGLDEIVDLDHIHRAYRRQVRHWHPDQFTHQPEIRTQAEERLKQINQAYGTLKDYLRTHPPAQKFSDTASQGDRAHMAKPEKPSTSFNWKKWFQPKKPRSDHNNAYTSRDETAQKSGGTSNNRRRPSFDRILQEAAKKSSRLSDRPYSKRGYITYGSIHRRCMKARKNGMRIEGHVSAAPITPVKPISRISKIESSG